MTEGRAAHCALPSSSAHRCIRPMLQFWRLPGELPQSPRHPRHSLRNRRCLALSRERMSQRRKRVEPSECVTGCLALEPEDASCEVAPRRLRLLQETCSVPPPHRLTWEPVLSVRWSHRCSISRLCRSPYALLIPGFRRSVSGYASYAV